MLISRCNLTLVLTRFYFHLLTEASTYTPASKHPYECGLKTRGDCRHLIGGYSEDIPGICYHKNTGMRIGRTGCRQIVIQVPSLTEIQNNISTFESYIFFDKYKCLTVIFDCFTD